LASSRSKVYQENYGLWGKDERAEEKIVGESKKEQFRYVLQKLSKHVDLHGKSILDIGTGNGYMLDAAKEFGMQCYGLELSKYASKVASKKFPGRIFNSAIGDIRTDRMFDIITMTDLIEHLQDVRKDFSKISSLLKDGGHLLMTTPNTGSFTRKLLGKKWFQYKFEHVIYFDKRSLRYLLKGFDILEMHNSTKLLKWKYYRLYIKKYGSRFISRLMPRFLDKFVVRNPALGELFVIARKK
jgi:2-polyprenyl-3-methyl-5-hydroxy-6-metoxy-1,4-benzoquinol methylase